MLGFSFSDQQVVQGIKYLYVRVWGFFESFLVQTIEVKAVQVCNSHEVMCCFYEWLPSLLCQRCDCHKLTDGILPPSLPFCLVFLSDAFLSLSDVFVFAVLFSVTFSLITSAWFWFALHRPLTLAAFSHLSYLFSYVALSFLFLLFHCWCCCEPSLFFWFWFFFFSIPFLLEIFFTLEFAVAYKRALSFCYLSFFLSCAYSFSLASLALSFLSVMFKTKGAVSLVSNYTDPFWADR